MGTIVDVSDKSNMKQLSRVAYARYFFWDVSDLENPQPAQEHIAGVKSIDHNLYIRGDRAYLANYVSGLRILDAEDLTTSTNAANGERELGFFDTSPNYSGVRFNGAWSNYPFFPSGNIVVSDIETGLFMLKSNV